MCIFKLKKTFLGINLFIALLVVLFIPVLADSGKSFNESEEFPYLFVSQITLSDESLNPVTELKPNEKIKASVEIKNNSDSEQELSMIIVLSVSNRLQSLYSETKTINVFSGEPVLVEKEIQLPDNTDNMELTVMLWNNQEEMIPVCPSMKIPEAGNGLRMIKADGEILSNFDEDIEKYEYKVSSELTSPIKIKAAALDGGTSFTISDPTFFPGETVINTVSPYGETKSYYVKYVCDDELISEPVLSPLLNARYKPVYKKDLRTGDDCFSDKASGKYSHFTYIDKLLEGKDWFSCPANWALLDSQKKIWSGNSNGSIGMFEFGITKSAVIRVICESECRVEDSFKENDGWTKTINESHPYYKRLYEESEKEATVMYEKTIHVNTGESKTVSIPNHGGAATYIVVIDYLYN